MYEVQCSDLAELAKLFSLFVKDGLCFQADAYRLVITLTGGY